MRKKPFGPAGLGVPVIGQGTWDIPESGARREEAIRALRRGIELGLTHIDTAEMYGSGAAEEIVGEAIAGTPRESLFVTSKVLPSNASYKGTLSACERSLRRIGTEYLDLYLLHWPGSHPLEETMRALETLVEQGKTRFIGVSNFDLAQVREAQSYLRGVRLASDQVLYHLKERGPEAQLLPYCEQERIALVGYTPFGRGRFPRKEAEPGGVLGCIAAAHGKTVRQVILNFLTREPGAFAIPKASHVQHVEENAGADGWQLAAEEIAQIDAAFPVHEGPLATL
ncbi:MAG TPA: aldo/keto reductase [Candidatus Baltobacteraceae bacterium]|nr:aldo/keto reductase [Candidatus Baltobacteraceae bacterium]